MTGNPVTPFENESTTVIVITINIYLLYLVSMIFANSLDPDETPRNAVSHKDANCLPCRSYFQNKKT